MRRRKSIGEILLASVRTYPRPPDPRLVAALRSEGLEMLLDAAVYHRVTSFVYKACRALGPVGTPVADALRPTYYQTVLTHRRTCEDLADLREAMSALGLPWLVMKGPVLAETVYPEPDMRAYGDLDAIVRPQDFRATVTGLEAAGFQLLDQNWVLAREQRFGEIHFLLPRGTVLDLHWHLLNQRALRHAFPMETNDLFEQPHRVEVAGQQVSTLSPTESILHLALHAAMAGANRLIWLNDLRLAAGMPGLDWELFVHLAAKRRLEIPVYTALRRARHILQAPVPVAALQALDCPRTWRGVAAVTDAVAPAQRSTSHGSLGRMVARATRQDMRSSLANLSSRIVSRATAEAHKRQGHDLEPDTASVMRPTGGLDDREAFIAGVAAER